MTHVSSQLAVIVWGFISKDVLLISDVEKLIVANYGEIIHKSDVIAFDYTDYYQSEMGQDLKRYWCATKNLIHLGKLSDIKLMAMRMEQRYQQNGKRTVNIDPGFLTLSNFVLATTKNYSHRIYLKDDIFAEVTLIFYNKSYQPLAWTYPDYRNNIQFFNDLRIKYQQLIIHNE